MLYRRRLRRHTATHKFVKLTKTRFLNCYEAVYDTPELSAAENDCDIQKLSSLAA